MEAIIWTASLEESYPAMDKVLIMTRIIIDLNQSYRTLILIISPTRRFSSYYLGILLLIIFGFKKDPDVNV
jgi:hypothetical protein